MSKIKERENISTLVEVGLKTMPVVNDQQVKPADTCGINYIYGVGALAKFLKCGYVTALRLKNSGKISYVQFGRKFQFNPNQVLSELSKNKIV